jgi:hypothetical protein
MLDPLVALPYTGWLIVIVVLALPGVHTGLE